MKKGQWFLTYFALHQGMSVTDSRVVEMKFRLKASKKERALKEGAKEWEKILKTLQDKGEFQGHALHKPQVIQVFTL